MAVEMGNCNLANETPDYGAVQTIGVGIGIAFGIESSDFYAVFDPDSDIASGRRAKIRIATACCRIIAFCCG